MRSPPTEQEDPAEFDRMVTSKPYTYKDPYISRLAKQGASQVKAINQEDDTAKRLELLRDFLDCEPEAEIHLVLPFFAEYVRPLPSSIHLFS